jgi:hypothetical protein
MVEMQTPPPCRIWFLDTTAETVSTGVLVVVKEFTHKAFSEYT